MASKKEKPKSGDVLFIPLNRLKKSPKNARKTPHTKAEIETLAASIGAKGLLQNLVVEPEQDRKGRATGYYLVTIGEGRRLAQMLRAKRKEIKKDEPIRCVIDTEHSAEEISLAENVVRSNMHPIDQFEAFAKLHTEQGMAAEDIAARFGVTAAVVKQRLKLAAVSPKLIQAYRNEEMTLEQLTAFTITDDHQKQEQVWEQLPQWSEGRSAILNALREDQVLADDRRTVFVGIQAYEAAGGAIARDLFDDEGEGFLTDSALLNRLVREKLQAAAAQVLTEGWKWVAVEPEFDYQLSAGMRRLRPVQPVLTEQQQARLETLQTEYDELYEEGNLQEDEGERSEEIDAKLAALDAEIIAITGGERYRPEHMVRAGAFVALGCDGEARIERGFVRSEDEDSADAAADEGEGSEGDAPQRGGPAPISDKLVAELSAYRTSALRCAVGGNPAAALIAVVHAFAAQSFYSFAESSCLDVKLRSAPLSSHAPGIAESPAERQIAERHEAWAKLMPEDPAALWSFIASRQEDERLTLLAHCASLTMNALRLPNAARADAQAHADTLAESLRLDMGAYWQPTTRSYFSRISKERILEAVREGVSEQAAQSIDHLKKQEMAEAAERLLAGTGWLPAILRTGAAPPSDTEA